MPTTTPTCRCLTGSTAGRGPCEACGAIAELHLAEEVHDSWLHDALGVAIFSRDARAVCQPCAERPDLPRAA